MSNLLQRSITGTLIVLVLISCIYMGKYYITGLFSIITILGLKEFYTLAETEEVKPLKLPGIIVGAITFIAATLYVHELITIKYLLILLPMVFFLFCIELLNKESNPLENISATIMGIVYLCIPMTLLSSFTYPPLLVNEATINEYNPHILLGFFYLLWVNDSGAYVVGSLIGKHKLNERVSPKKTWEGTIGGGLFCIGTAYLISLYYNELNLIQWSIMAIIISSMGTLGDLVQSMFKRSTNIKDSGTLLPGHGGILDRFDGVLISSPFVFTYLQLLNN